MNSSRRFFVALAGCLVVYLAYGWGRFHLGIDFTDEGAYLAWPLRSVFGERYFAGDPLLLLRPMFALMAGIYRLWPGISLFEVRLLGWLLHLAAFATLATYLFRLSRDAGQSLLVASVPLFACQVFGLATPSYNSFSSDFLLIAFSLRGLADEHFTPRSPRVLAVGAGLALFLATFGHPGLGLVAAAILVHELWAGKLLQNLRHRATSASNVAVIVFVACWIVALVYFFGSGDFADWWSRLPLAQPRDRETLHDHPARFYLVLLAYPFFYSRLATVTTAALAPLAILTAVWLRREKKQLAARATTALAVLLFASLIATISYEADYVPANLARTALLVVAIGCIAPPAASTRETRFLLLLSLLAALSYATLTYYFSPLRSWNSGLLGLPFALAAGLMLVVSYGREDRGVMRVSLLASLALLVVCLVREHYRNIYRDGAPSELAATFQNPKLRGVRSTAERVQAVEALYARLHPQLARGEPLLAFDDCPLLYFVFDTRPTYGLTWAVRYTQSPSALRRHDEELRGRPLPRFAIRTQIDLSRAVWRDAPRTSYDNYPLNATLLANYSLTGIIFPFEIWELKSGGPREKASPGKLPP